MGERDFSTTTSRTRAWTQKFSPEEDEELPGNGSPEYVKARFLSAGVKASVHVQRPLRSWPNSAEALSSSPWFLSGPRTLRAWL